MKNYPSACGPLLYVGYFSLMASLTSIMICSSNTLEIIFLHHVRSSLPASFIRCGLFIFRSEPKTLVPRNRRVNVTTIAENGEAMLDMILGRE